MEDRTNPTQSTLRRLLLLAGSLGVGAVGWFLLGLPEAVIAEEQADAGKAMARVDGVAISEDEILELAAAEILKLNRQRHQVLESIVNAKVRERLLELGAQKVGVTTDNFILNEVHAKTSAVDAAEVNAFYEARKARIRQPLEQAEPQIREFLAMEALIARLETEHEIDYLLQPFRVEVEATGPAKGPADAPITIVEFSDFQCPYCSRVNPSLQKVRESYGEKVRIVFRQFPLAIHADAPKASEASLCAAEQDEGLFWKLHDAMFADQHNLNVASLKEKATAIEGLDSTAFAECLGSDRFAQQVADDLKAGTRAGVTGTPAFFVNGRFISGAAAFESFAKIIDDELQRAGKG